VLAGIARADSAAEQDEPLSPAITGLWTGRSTRTPDGSVDWTNTDHGDADAIPGATLTAEDPLAGIKELARQVRASGITEVQDNVVIDDAPFFGFRCSNHLSIRLATLQFQVYARLPPEEWITRIT
jgi:hypothetical protein